MQLVALYDKEQFKGIVRLGLGMLSVQSEGQIQLKREEVIDALRIQKNLDKRLMSVKKQG